VVGRFNGADLTPTDSDPVAYDVSSRTFTVQTNNQVLYISPTYAY